MCSAILLQRGAGEWAPPLDARATTPWQGWSMPARTSPLPRQGPQGPGALAPGSQPSPPPGDDRLSNSDTRTISVCSCSMIARSSSPARAARPPGCRGSLRYPGGTVLGSRFESHLPRRNLDAGLSGGRLSRSGRVRISSNFRTL
jgi:hypothetical protein